MQSSALASARATVATYIGAQTAGALISVADNYANISARLKLATDGHKAYATASAQVFNISQRTATALDARGYDAQGRLMFNGVSPQAERRAQPIRPGSPNGAVRAAVCGRPGQ